MKLKITALFLSAVVFTTVTALVGCNNKNDNSSNLLDQSQESATQFDPLAPAETESQTESSESISATEAETVTTEPPITQKEQLTTESNEAPVIDENGAVILEIDDTVDDVALIASAQILYESAGGTQWDFSVGCPYEIDYNSYIENEFDWKFYLIVSDEIKSIADVENDYYKVFSSNYGNPLDELYKEKDGRVYALAGQRGSDIYYTGSKVTGITRRTENEIFFSVENYYSGSDYSNFEPVTKTEEFSAVIDKDGNWRVGVYKMPF